MSTLASRVGRTLLIVPAAHYRIFDVRLQLALYELFHRKALCRLGHALCTPGILFGIYLLLGRISAPVSPLYALSLVLFWAALRVDQLAGLVLLAPLAVLHAAAGRVPAASAVPLGLALVLGGALLQTISHAVEDVPPPTSGTAGFVPVREWLAAARTPRLLGTALLLCFVFTLLELWAATRIWPLQVLHLLTRLGYRPALRRDIEQQVDALLADLHGALSRSRV